MFTLIYVSSAVNLFSDAELIELLEKARKNNTALGITGMLLYQDGNFMQLLEGPEEAVKTLAAKIMLDPRHCGFLKLLERQTEQREFGEWKMGFKKIDKDFTGIPGYSDFLNVPFSSDTYKETPSKALKLMLNFKQMVR
jgi:hypothetical protein